MIDADNFHSRLVGWSKILLPLAALGLLSTLFLLARDPGQASEISFAEIQAIAREQRLSSPRFSGVTENGTVLSLVARSARPELTDTETFNIENVDLRMEIPDGSTVDISATTGQVDSRAQSARFYGLARLTTSSGYEMETNSLTAELKTGVVTSGGVLEIQGPFGELTAGRVILKASEDNVGQQMLFTDGVRLIYHPQHNQTEAQ